MLETSKYENFEEFMTAVQALWDRQWEVVHAAPREGVQYHAMPILCHTILLQYSVL